MALGRYKSMILYGLGLAVLLFLLKWLEWRFLIVDHALEIYSVALALLFTGLGIWLALKLVRPGQPREKSPGGHGLSTREVEVLELMAEGLSNQEIAARLFVSQNTVKTHASNIFEKLDVRRRTQAVDRARKLKILHP